MSRFLSLFRAFLASLWVPPPKRLCPVMDRHRIIDEMIDRLPPAMADRYSDLEHESYLVTDSPEGTESGEGEVIFTIRFPGQSAFNGSRPDLQKLIATLGTITGSLWIGWEKPNDCEFKFSPLDIRREVS